MEERETRMEVQITKLTTAVVDGLRLLSGDIRHNARMSGRVRRQEWNRTIH